MISFWLVMATLELVAYLGWGLGFCFNVLVEENKHPAMDAAVMSFHLSLSPTSSSSLTRFRPVCNATQKLISCNEFSKSTCVNNTFLKTGLYKVINGS